jgi:REP element-mobilizing transposase RayT
MRARFPAMAGNPQSHRLRIGRHNELDRAYLLTACCRDRTPHFADPLAAGIALETLRWLDEAGRIELFAVVVMPDHLHFVAVLRQGSLSRLMHSLKRHAAYAIHRERGKSGGLWQSGYHDRALRDDRGLVDAIGYCLRNPQRAGLVANFRDYPYSWCKWGLG